jgi:putative aminopeptidase FrvX
MRPQSRAFLIDLVNAPSPSGYEQPAAKVFRDYTASFASRVSTDGLGNVAAVLNPDAKLRIMLAAHMDEIGFVIHHIGDDGLLFFSPVGAHDEVVPLGQRVSVHGRERIPGVVGSRAFHLLDSAARQSRPDITKLWIDIGATSRAEAEALVRLGDPITFQYEFQPLLGERVAARAIDNKAGVFILAEALRLLSEEGGLHPEVAVHGVATVQEEIGSRGAQTATFDVAPTTALAIDMDHATDIPRGDPARHGLLAIGKGPSVSRGPNINPVVFDLLAAAARDEQIPYQVSVFSKVTPTDANALQVSRGGVPAGLVGVPIRYMHTPSETVSLADLEGCARLVAAYCRRVTPETDFTPRC